MPKKKEQPADALIEKLGTFRQDQIGQPSASDDESPVFLVPLAPQKSNLLLPPPFGSSPPLMALPSLEKPQAVVFLNNDQEAINSTEVHVEHREKKEKSHYYGIGQASEWLNAKVTKLVKISDLSEMGDAERDNYIIKKCLEVEVGRYPDFIFSYMWFNKKIQNKQWRIFSSPWCRS